MAVPRRIFLGAGTLFLSGCVTAPHTLQLSDVRQLKLAGVTVEGIEVIRSWPAEERAYLAAHPDPALETRLQSEPASNFPQLQAHFKRVLTERVAAEARTQLNPVLGGARPAQLVVRLKTFDVPSTARRVFVDNDAKIQADIALVDARTRSPILSYDGPYRQRRLIGGLATGIALALDQSDTGQSLIVDYVSAYRAWLLQA